MILFLRHDLLPRAVTAGTCDVSLGAASQSALKSLSQPVSNAVGNECSESMRVMCGRVGFSVRANAQVYAPRSSWNVQEPRGRNSVANFQSSLLLLLSPPLSSYYSLSHHLSLFLPTFTSLTGEAVLSLSAPCGQVFCTETKD